MKRFTAINPETGERIQSDDGGRTWQPIEKGILEKGWEFLTNPLLKLSKATEQKMKDKVPTVSTWGGFNPALAQYIADPKTLESLSNVQLPTGLVHGMLKGGEKLTSPLGAASSVAINPLVKMGAPGLILGLTMAGDQAANAYKNWKKAGESPDENEKLSGRTEAVIEAAMATLFGKAALGKAPKVAREEAPSAWEWTKGLFGKGSESSPINLRNARPIARYSPDEKPKANPQQAQKKQANLTVAPPPKPGPKQEPLKKAQLQTSPDGEPWYVKARRDEAARKAKEAVTRETGALPPKSSPLPKLPAFEPPPPELKLPVVNQEGGLPRLPELTGQPTNSLNMPTVNPEGGLSPNPYPGWVGEIPPARTGNQSEIPPDLVEALRAFGQEPDIPPQLPSDFPGNPFDEIIKFAPRPKEPKTKKLFSVKRKDKPKTLYQVVRELRGVNDSPDLDHLGLREGKLGPRRTKKILNLKKTGVPHDELHVFVNDKGDFTFQSSQEVLDTLKDNPFITSEMQNNPRPEKMADADAEELLRNAGEPIDENWETLQSSEGMERPEELWRYREPGEEGGFAVIKDKDQKGFNFAPINVEGQSKQQGAKDLLDRVLKADDSSVSKRDLLGLRKTKAGKAIDLPLFKSKNLLGE